MTTVSQEAREAEVTVREIETVTGDFLTEAGEPFYRIEINGYCADFDYREAAENFAAAINQMVARHRQSAERGEVVAWLYERKGFAPAVSMRDPRLRYSDIETLHPLYTLPAAPEAGQ